jgi:hypothetical protein
VSSSAVWLLALLAAEPAPVVKVEREAGSIRVEAQMSVSVDPGTAWGVLTDYNHLSEFMPDVRESRVVSEPHEPIRVAQKGLSGLFRVPIDLVLEVEESLCSKVTFKSIKGNVKQLRGEWRIAGSQSPVAILYAAHLEPEFWVPPLLGPVLIRHDVEAQMRGLAREMIRRRERGTASAACGRGAVGP